MSRWLHILVAAACAVAATAPRAAARPTYFDIFTAHYGLSSGDDLYACGVCHQRWQGTGARNPYGTAIEQQIYVGKPILQAIEDIESNDTDGDGFTNLEEIATYGTLPGYNCSDFFQAINPPADYHTFITPLVASCLEPLDIRVEPTSLSILGEVGTTTAVPVELFNNGSDLPVSVSAYGLLSGTSGALALTGPGAPFDIPVGQHATLNVVFSPAIAGSITDTLRITSNDPDEGTIDIPLSSLAFSITRASAEKRAVCFAEVGKQDERYAKKHLGEWARCFLAEVGGVACDTGRRDSKLAQAAGRLRAKIGGEKDKRCAGAGLTPNLLGLPTACAAPCEGIVVTSIAAFADCLVCRQEAATSAMLSAVVGTAPPDLPANSAGGGALGCQKQLLKSAQKGIGKLLKRLDACELDNLTAATPAVCTTALAADIGEIQAGIDARFDQCADTTGLLGCRLEPMPVASCLGDAVLSIGTALNAAAFGLGD